MKLKSITCAVLALVLSLGNLTFAQGRGERGDRERNDRERLERNHDRVDQSRRDPLAQHRANAPRPADYGRGDDRRGDNRQWNNRRGYDNRPDGRYERYERHDRGDRYGGNHRYSGPRGAGPNHQYYRGDRLPYEYRVPQWVVNDWHGHGLQSPPHGYRWVQYGSDYLLVAIATGVILQLLLND